MREMRDMNHESPDPLVLVVLVVVVVPSPLLSRSSAKKNPKSKIRKSAEG